MNTFEFDGEKYKLASKHQKEWGNKLIQDLQLDGNEAILDLGCGDGLLTMQLTLLVPNGRVLGVDASSGMIETAEKQQKDNLEFKHMDINEMQFINEFDIIFSNAALHWVKDHSRLLKNTYSALKPQGRILWNFGGDGNCRNFFKVIREIIKRDNYREHFHDFEWPWYMPAMADYDVLVKQSGFSEAKVTEENADRYFSNKEEIIKWIDQPSIVPFIKCIPDHLKASFRNDVIDAMMDLSLQPDGTCFETFRRIQVSAVK
ncbi:MAG: class I SAM-dependent methyltransferase [Lachnospiraceae bacterium]